MKTSSNSYTSVQKEKKLYKLPTQSSGAWRSSTTKIIAKKGIWGIIQFYYLSSVK